MESISLLFHWVIKHILEICGTVTGLIYLVYSVKGDIRLWIYGLISSAFYVVVFFKSKVYADMAINFYYVVISIYGFFHWKYGKKKDKVELPILRLSKRLMLPLFAITLSLFFGIAYILKSFTDSDVAYMDAMLTAASIVATWMLSRKIFEQWIIWILVDAISIGLFAYKGLLITVLLFIVNTTLAVFGYIEWKKLWKLQQCKA